MNVLLVTDQYVDVRPDGCYCNYALLGTLKNMSIIGELHIIASKQSLNRKSAQPVNKQIDFVSVENVWHFKSVTTSISDYCNNKLYNRRLLESIIPNMDLVIGYTPGHNISTAFRIARRKNVPYMTFLVACPWDTMYNHQRLLVRSMASIYYLQTKRVVKQSDYVHYVTNSFLQKRYPSNGKSLGCSDVHLWEQLTNVLEIRHDKLEQKTEDTPVSIVTIAHVDMKNKGQEYVIRAIAKLAKQNHNKYHYYLIGAGEGNYLKRLSIKLNLEDNVHFLGRKTTEEIKSLLNKADIYIQPSLTEGLPRAVVEAMSMALPCIGFNAGGIPELINSQFVVPKKSVKGIIDCIKQLENSDVYKSESENNYHKAQEFEHFLLTKRICNFFIQIKEDIFAK